MKVFSGDTKSYHFSHYNHWISEVEKYREKHPLIFFVGCAIALMFMKFYQKLVFLWFVSLLSGETNQ